MVTAPSCTEEGVNDTLLLQSSSWAVFTHRLLIFVQAWRFAGVQSPAVSQASPFQRFLASLSFLLHTAFVKLLAPDMERLFEKTG